MNMLRATALALMIAAAAPMGSAGAQGVLQQLGGGGGSQGVSGLEAPKSDLPCKLFESTLQMRSAGPWAALDIVPDRRLARTEDAETALRLRGGVLWVMEVDDLALRKQMLAEAREEIMRVARNERIGASPIVRGDTIEFRPRSGVDMAAALKAFAPLISGPAPMLVLQGNDDDRVVRGIIVFAPSEQAFDDRLQSSLRNSIEPMRRRLNDLGLEEPFFEIVGRDRFIVIVPGFKNFEQWPFPLESTAKLTLRIADRFADPCGPAEAMSPDAEVLKAAAPNKTMLVVQRRVELSGEHFTEARVVRDGGTGPAVVVRLNRLGQERLARVTQSNIGQALAIVLDNEVIAMTTIREPIVDGMVLFSGGLTMEQANHLVVLMRVAMPRGPLTIVEQRTFRARP